jgi:hypothetical protein
MQLKSGKELKPLRFYRRHKTVPVVEYREVSCLVADLVGPCHEWIRGRNDNGYGKTDIGGRKIYIHRFVWESKNGQIPDGLVIDHRCRNKLCCNVDHLRLVTRKINNIENSDSICAVNARKTHCVNGHEFTEENTKLYRGRVCRKCVAEKNKKHNKKKHKG